MLVVVVVPLKAAPPIPLVIFHLQTPVAVPLQQQQVPESLATVA